MEDPYVALGVRRDASQDDIRAAYRKLAKLHHPDLNPGNAEAEEKFKTVSAANELLSDPDKRARFDRGEIDAAGQERQRAGYRDQAESAAGHRYSRAGPQDEAWDGADFNDLFGSMFNQSRRASGGPRRGEDRHYTLTAAFLDAVNGATRRLTLPDGRALDVKIPPGTSQGQVLRLRGQGGGGIAGGADGDALIEIDIDPHPFFERRGNDIRLVLPVTVAEAALGGSIKVPTPAGPVMMRIPPHSAPFRHRYGTSTARARRSEPCRRPRRRSAGHAACRHRATRSGSRGIPQDLDAGTAFQSASRIGGPVMITIDVLVNQTEGLNRVDLELWIRNDWVRPEVVGGVLCFGEIDVARVILIRELRDDLDVNDAALPVVLSLIDQLYDLRRHVRHLSEVLQDAVPSDVRAEISERLTARML